MTSFAFMLVEVPAPHCIISTTKWLCSSRPLERPVYLFCVPYFLFSRPPLKSLSLAGETGGLSGKVLFERSTIVLAKMRKLLGPKTAIVGVGGVSSAETALEKIRAGADLVQLYTSMIYAGPALPGRIVSGMSEAVGKAGLQSLSDLRDASVDTWAARPL